MTSPTSNMADQLITLNQKVADIVSQRVTYVAGTVSSLNIAGSTFGADIAQPDGTIATVTGIGTTPQFLPAVGNVVTLALSGSQIIYQPYGVAGGSIDTPQLAPAVTSSISTASSNASSAVTTANGAAATAATKITTFYAGVAPTSGMNAGDLWVNIGSNNTLYRYSGSSWVQIQDQQIQSALVAAGTAQATADGKIQSFYQTTAPTSGMSVGDLWFDTDDGNKNYRYSGTAWVLVQDQSIAAALATANTAQATANSKVLIFAQSTTPTAQEVGDMWFNTGNGNQLAVWGPTPTVTRVNYALNPSFEADASGTQTTIQSWNNYSSGSVGTITRSIVTTGGVTNGTKAVKSSSSSQAATAGVGHGFQQSYVAASGNIFRVQATFQLATSGANFVPHVQVEPLNSSNTVLAGTVTASGSGTTTSAQTLNVTTAALPTGTASVRLTVQRRTAATTGTALATSDITIDSVLVEKNRDAAAPVTYFDGNTPISTDSKWDTPTAAPNSTSTYWQPGVSGVNAWQVQQLRNAAIQTQSILGNQAIAYQSITAPLLESLLVLTGTVIAGNPNADHAALMTDGLHLFRTVTGEGVQEVGTLAVGAFGTQMQWVNSAGKMVAQVDSGGVATFSDLNVTDDPVFQGRSLADSLTKIPGGGGAGTIKPGARNYVGWNSGAATSVITAEVGLFEISVIVESSRIYWVIPSFWYTVSDSVTYVDVKVRDGGSGTPTTSSLVIDQSFFSPGAQFGWSMLAERIRPYRFSAGTHRLLVTVAAGGSGWVNVLTPSGGANDPMLSVIDMGPDYGNPASVNRGAGGTPTPTQQYYVELSPDGWTSYTGSGTPRSDTTDVVQGTPPDGSNGDGTGLWWFNSTLPSITGTVDRVDWYCYTNYTYFSSGATAVWNIVSNGAGWSGQNITNKVGSGGDQFIANYPKPGPKTWTLPSSWWPQFKNTPPSGARAVGIAAGDPGAADAGQYYARFDGPSARLRIWYTQ